MTNLTSGNNSPDFRTLFESAPGLYLVLTADLTIAAASDAYLAATMTKRDDIIGRGLFEVFPDNPDDPTSNGVRNLKESLNRVLMHRKQDSMGVQKYDIRRPESDGGGFEERYWSPLNSPVFGANGSIAYIIHRVEDVTDFVRLRSHKDSLNEELRGQAERLEAEVFMQAQELQEVNRQLRSANDELATKEAERERLLSELLKTQGRLEGRVKDRTEELETAVKNLRLEMIERERAQTARQVSEQRYRVLFEANPQPMWVYDRETLKFLDVNDAAVAHYGYSKDEFLSMTIREIRPPEDVTIVEDAVRQLSSEETLKVQRRHKKKDGSLIDVEGSSREVLVGGRRARLVLAIDTTERKRLEEQLRQSQKMEAVGRLAGGVAHDFNNILTIIIGYSELALRSSDVNAKMREILEEIKTSGERAALLTNQLLAFSRKQVLQPRILDLNEIVAAADKMLRRVIPENIDLATITRQGLGSVLLDSSQIEQIVLNLAINARDAMPNGGKLTVETANVTLDESYARNHADVVPGEYVVLVVSDTGQGMDEETQSRIFDPFFTTKERGKGTGLGLSTVYGIVKQSGGHIWLYSEPGKGATFKAYFPRVNQPASSAERSTADNEGLTGNELILLVEDDDLVRRLARASMETYGYRVLETASGKEAIEIAKRSPNIKLLVTDVIMPEMNGRELAVEIEKVLPDAKILFISGYTENAIVHHGVLDRGVAFLQKPFTPDALARKIRGLVDRRETA